MTVPLSKHPRGREILENAMRKHVEILSRVPKTPYTLKTVEQDRWCSKTGMPLAPPWDWVWVRDEFQDHAYQAWSDPDPCFLFSPRRDLITHYSWSIPTSTAIKAIAAHGPVLDPLAGTGYWAGLLSQHTDVLASDIAPMFGNYYHGTGHRFYPMKRFDAVRAVQQWGAERTLLMSWPPYESTLATRMLMHYRGDTIAYVGEHSGGCCADETFFRTLHAGWEEVEAYEIPQWMGMHDYVSIHKRKLTRDQSIAIHNSILHA